MLPTGHREKTLIFQKILGTQLSPKMSAKMYKKKSCSFQITFFFTDEETIKKKRMKNFTKMLLYIFYFNSKIHVFISNIEIRSFIEHCSNIFRHLEKEIN